MTRTAEDPTAVLDAQVGNAAQARAAVDGVADQELSYRRAFMDLALERRARLQQLDLARRTRLQELLLRRFLAYFSCATFATCILVARALFCLQELHAWSFHLETPLMHWLGGATIGSLASLMTLVYKRLL